MTADRKITAAWLYGWHWCLDREADRSLADEALKEPDSFDDADEGYREALSSDEWW